MYVPTWVLCLLSAIGGGILAFLGMVVAVVIQQSNKKKGE